jgi:hypothetical protein
MPEPLQGNLDVQVVVAPRPFHRRRPFLLLLCLGLTGCDLGGDASYPQPRYRHQTAPQYRQSSAIFGSISTDGGGPVAPNATIGVDNRLWRAALETVSFMPLVSADATSGVIITDWYAAPNAPNERQKVNVYILGRELRADSLRVSVFRQQRGSDGAWADAPAADKAATDFASAILTRARQVSMLDSATLRIGKLPSASRQT